MPFRAVWLDPTWIIAVGTGSSQLPTPPLAGRECLNG